MHQNPYKYTGPLDPVKDELVCVPRTEEVNRVIEGIMQDEYWAVIGPGQVGKTTFLRQIQQQFPHAYYIYVDLKISRTNGKNFYQWLIKELLKKIPSTRDSHAGYDWSSEKPEFLFYRFLETFKPQDNTRKIILLIDKIENLPFLRSFLHTWRKVYHERDDKEELYKYAVIITGSINLIQQTIGPNSPFNIAEIFEIKDFSYEESADLIEKPISHLSIRLEPDAKEYLLSQVSGHPQLIQHLCFLITDMAVKQKKSITVKDINDAIDLLFKTNSTLELLRKDINNNQALTNLIKDVLEGKKRVYHPSRDFSISGVGAIVDKENFCSIRNGIYEKFLRDLLSYERR
jgi:hypothetical protein